MAGPSGKPLLVAPPTPGCLRAAAAAAKSGAAAFGGAGAPDWRLFQPPGSAGTKFWPPPQAARLLLLWPDEPANRGDLSGDASAPDKATESDHEGTSPTRVPRGRHAKADGYTCLSEPACKCAPGREAPGTTLEDFALPSQLSARLRCGCHVVPNGCRHMQTLPPAVPGQAEWWCPLRSRPGSRCSAQPPCLASVPSLGRACPLPRGELMQRTQPRSHRDRRRQRWQRLGRTMQLTRATQVPVRLMYPALFRGLHCQDGIACR